MYIHIYICTYIHVYIYIYLCTCIAKVMPGALLWMRGLQNLSAGFMEQSVQDVWCSGFGLARKIPLQMGAAEQDAVNIWASIITNIRLRYV